MNKNKKKEEKLRSEGQPPKDVEKEHEKLAAPKHRMITYSAGQYFHP